MSHYEERIEADLEVIRTEVSEVARSVEEAIGGSVRALLHGDRKLAAQIILGDLPINRATREIERLCHVFVARHLPSAGVLRYISSVLRLMVGLERIGDYAVTISREAVQLSTSPPEAVKRDIDLMSDQARRLFGEAVQAFTEGNAELARGATGMATQAKSTFQKVFADLQEEGEKGSRPIKDLFALLIVLNRLERISDQAKNICEETLFAATGETKTPNTYRVLFVDEENCVESLMAEAIARKAFPAVGEYSSAGWAPAEVVDPPVVEFLDRHGHDVRDLRPAQLGVTYADLNDYHLIVGVGSDVSTHFEEIPFHTVVTEWELTEGQDLEATYKELALKVRELAELLHGEQAS